MYKKYGKPLLDIFFSFLLILILSPLMILLAILIRINLGSPILFKQVRVGLNKKEFTIYKFRTMKNIIASDKDRTTKFTRFLRNFGLDELPQLFNIIKQDMSFVGPRPFIANEKLPDTKIDDMIYTVLPGITGLAQSKGRRAISHQQRLKYDCEYVQNISFLLDLKIIFSTIKLLIIQNIKR